MRLGLTQIWKSPYAQGGVTTATDSHHPGKLTKGILRDRWSGTVCGFQRYRGRVDTDPQRLRTLAMTRGTYTRDNCR